MSKELLYSVTKKDLKIETMRGSGKGGQHRNKTDSAARITHPESGAIGYSEDERSQLQNKRTAFRRMVNSQEFQLWNIRKAAILMGLRKSPQEIEREVVVSMNEENLKIEYLEGN